MKLIGMLDSPYVRRTAISLSYLGIPFEHRAVSVFSHFAEFQQINPVVKAPTLVFDSGEVLMDSSLILQLAETMAQGRRSLLPENPLELRQALCSISSALAACEKAVQIVYERSLRPAAQQYQPWLARITGQLLAACAVLEADIATRRWAFDDAGISQVEITAAVAWQFIQSNVPDIVSAGDFSALQELAQTAEQLPLFIAFPPIGPGV